MSETGEHDRQSPGSAPRPTVVAFDHGAIAGKALRAVSCRPGEQPPYAVGRQAAVAPRACRLGRYGKSAAEGPECQRLGLTVIGRVAVVSRSRRSCPSLTISSWELRRPRSRPPGKDSVRDMIRAGVRSRRWAVRSR